MSLDELPRAPFSAVNAPLICFSHLRWDFVTQRPQHLMSRFAAERPVWFWEEAIPTDHHLPYLEFHAFAGTSVQAIRPRIPRDLTEAGAEAALAALLDQMIGLTLTTRPVLWFYSPRMWRFARHVQASAVVYDCMDELANFRFAPADLKRDEAALMAAADVVFTGGYSLYEARADRHDNIHPFPSGVDAAHFARARQGLPDPADQAALPHPRLGFYGVIDERLDLPLIGRVAAARPGWQIVMLGPLAKISAADLPRAPNIHWLGQKRYEDLPAYLSGWDVALMPFAINEATRYISPTKTPEYLAGGLPVVSTPIRDVVRHYGDLPAVRIAGDVAGFVAACEGMLTETGNPCSPAVDQALAEMGWDATQARMGMLIKAAEAGRSARWLAGGAVAAGG